MKETKPSTGLSVVIAVYNEVENITILLDEIEKSLDKSLFEAVVVDDGSTDGTYECLMNHKAKMPNLVVIRHRKNSGQSAAIISGVEAANYDWIATLDGDGQNDPADIPRLFEIATAAKKSVLIAGSRAKNRNDSFVKKWSSKIANAVRGWMLKDDCPDTGCGLKIFERRVFLQLPLFNHVHRFLPALFKRSGSEVVIAAVNHRPRLRGESKYGVWNRLWVGIVDIIGVMWLIRRPAQAEKSEAE